MPTREDAAKALDRTRESLAQRHPIRFASALWYGAVDIDPKYLVVWVLLAGPADRIPTWFFPATDEPGDGYDAELLTAIHDMRAIVVAAYQEAGWPDAAAVKVGFDSTERVAAQGGFAYFK
jgi:hypothetical protein